jgi:hypothetical protein
MWSSEEAAEIRAIATQAKPGIKTHAIPQGLQVEKGPDAIVAYLVEIVPGCWTVYTDRIKLKRMDWDHILPSSDGTGYSRLGLSIVV